MKRLIITVALGLFLGLFITGCSSNNSSTEVIPLTIGEETIITSGDKISPKDETTQIELRHVLDTDKKYVTLLAGSADLIRGNFTLTE